jgi:hypothetical protein
VEVAAVAASMMTVRVLVAEVGAVGRYVVDGVGGGSLIISGTADAFESAKAAALFEALAPQLTRG